MPIDADDFISYKLVNRKYFIISYLVEIHDEDNNKIIALLCLGCKACRAEFSILTFTG